MLFRSDMGTSPAPGRVLGHAWAVRVDRGSETYWLTSSRSWLDTEREMRKLWRDREEAQRARRWFLGQCEAHSPSAVLVRVTFRGTR